MFLYRVYGLSHNSEEAILLEYIVMENDVAAQSYARKNPHCSFVQKGEEVYPPELERLRALGILNTYTPPNRPLLLLTTRDIAHRVDKSEEWVNRKIRNGELVPIGRTQRNYNVFLEMQVDEFVKLHKPPPVVDSILVEA
ncbi:hypothetical protein KBC70_03865 [Candidatus Woesebacteria bacterium]|nr:hypothetical protein [Candidatus Woesebacteria bacterium]